MANQYCDVCGELWTEHNEDATCPGIERAPKVKKIRKTTPE